MEVGGSANDPAASHARAVARSKTTVHSYHERVLFHTVV